MRNNKTIELFRNFCFKILYTLRIGHYLHYLNKKKNRIPVLVFHKIIPDYDSVWPGIHPQLFENILLLLKKHYTILPINDLFTKTEAELKNACFITFDDGYKDYLDYAYPILKKHGISSALFILPYQITNKGHIWTSTVTFLIKHYRFDEIETFFKAHNVSVNPKNRFNYFQLNLDITKQLCNMMHADRMKIIYELREKFVRDNRIIENELLSFEELKTLDPKLTQIGSHSLTHPSFINENDSEFIEIEMKKSKEIIEKELGYEVSAFAFPFANYNEKSYNIAKQIYKICFTGLNDFIHIHNLKTNSDSPNDLKRFNVHHNSAEEVFFLMNGFHKKLGH